MPPSTTTRTHPDQRRPDQTHPDQTHSVSLDQVAALSHELLRLQRRRHQVHPGLRLESSAFRLLWVLSDGRARTLKELAAELELERSTINRQVHGAIGAGLVERFRPEGSPSGLVRPTAAGVTAYRHDAGVRGAVIQEALGTLGADGAADLVARLRDLNDAWDAALAR